MTYHSGFPNPAFSPQKVPTTITVISPLLMNVTVITLQTMTITMLSVLTNTRHYNHNNSLSSSILMLTFMSDNHHDHFLL